MSFLEQEVLRFLKERRRNGRPVLLGLSGGPDSTALLHLLAKRVPLVAAHLDHGWREESAQEAATLQLWCERLGVSLMTKRLELGEGTNSEEVARDARISFFSECMREVGAEALLLGHHADDQAETVLKRVLEGAPLAKQAAIRPVSERGNLTIWRPLLTIPKKKIVAWLQERDLPYFTDRTNFDGSNLRSRLRTEMIPELFGKEVAAPLSRHAHEAAELADYLDRKVLAVKEEWERERRVDLSDYERVEIKHFLRSIARLSVQQVRELADAIVERRSHLKQGDLLAKNGVLSLHTGAAVWYNPAK